MLVLLIFILIIIGNGRLLHKFICDRAIRTEKTSLFLQQGGSQGGAQGAPAPLAPLARVTCIVDSIIV